jgi:hypothetical protein
MAEDMIQTSPRRVARRTAARRSAAQLWPSQPHSKKLNKLFNALIGVARRDKGLEQILYDIAEKEAERADCDDVYWVDADEDGMTGGSENPDIPMDGIRDQHEGEWIEVIRRKSRKFDGIVTEILSLHDEDEDEVLEDLDEAFSEVLFEKVLDEMYDGEELEDVYGGVRDQCDDQAAYDKDPYAYYGVSRSDFYGSKQAAGTLMWHRDIKPALETAGQSPDNDRTWAPWSKDVDRVENIRVRAKYDPAKMLRLSENMAKSIKNLVKAVRRGRAADDELGLEYAQPFYRKVMELIAGRTVFGSLSKMAPSSIPKKVEEKAKEVAEGNPSYDEAKVWATAWSIYCKHIEPGSDHCSKKPGEYLKKKAAADDSWTGMVEVEALTDEDELDDEDADMLRDAPYGPYTVSARNKRDAEEAILDAFANDVPVSLPEDFDIEVKRLKKASRTAGGEVTIADVERFVKRQRTYMDVDRKDQRSLSLITREGGDMENDEPGEGDLDEARRVGRAVAKEFGRDAVTVEMDYMDEWVTLDIRLKKAGQKTAGNIIPEPDWKEHVRRGAFDNVCPWCGVDAVDAEGGDSWGQPEVEVEYELYCHNCGGKWMEYHKLYKAGPSRGGSPSRIPPKKPPKPGYPVAEHPLCADGACKTARADRELLKDWAEHAQKNRRRWEGRKYDADDWYDEAVDFAEEYWKFHNLDPWDDIPKREVEEYAMDNAPDMLTHVDAPSAASASKVARRHAARRPSKKQKQLWMRKYTELTGDPQPKPHDYWDTATYLMLSGHTPEEAAKGFKRGSRTAGPGAGVDILLSGESRKYRAGKPDFDWSGDLEMLDSGEVDGVVKVKDLTIASYYDSARIKSQAGTIEGIDLGDWRKLAKHWLGVIQRDTESYLDDEDDEDPGAGSSGYRIPQKVGDLDAVFDLGEVNNAMVGGGYARGKSPGSFDVDGTGTVEFHYNGDYYGAEERVEWEGQFITSSSFDAAWNALDYVEEGEESYDRDMIFAREKGGKATVKKAVKMDRERLRKVFRTKDDEGFKRTPGYISISWVSEKQEDKLRDIGFDFPTRKEGNGPITYKGKKVGYATNFGGLMFKDEDVIWKHRRVFEQIGFWYTNG